MQLGVNPAGPRCNPRLNHTNNSPRLQGGICSGKETLHVWNMMKHIDHCDSLQISSPKFAVQLLGIESKINILKWKDVGGYHGFSVHVVAEEAGTTANLQDLTFG